MATASVSVALRDFLLVVERVKQPLDQALQQFATTAAAAPHDAVLRAFLEVHPQCEPFLLIWPDESGRGTRWEARDSIAVFLELVTRLLHVHVRVRGDAAAAELVALKVIREKSLSLEKLMSWSDKPLIECRVLEFMTAMVRVSPTVAREFVRIFNFQSTAFTKMATRRLKKPVPTEADDEEEEEEEADEDSGKDTDMTDTSKQMATAPAFQIREAYVRLVLALAACPDKSVHRFALKDNGVASSLFKSLDGDDADLLALILGELRTLVLRNANLDARGKAAFFNTFAVQQLTTVLKAEDEGMAEQAWDMLSDLFFAEDGLYRIPHRQSLRLFLAKSVNGPGSSGSVNAIVDTSEEPTAEKAVWSVKIVRSALTAVGLAGFIGSEYARRLVLTFISECPGLLAEYFSVLSPQLEPKPGYRWFSVVSMVQRLLSCPLDAAVADLQSGGETQSQYTAQFIATRVLLPFSCRKELSRGIQHSNSLLIYASLGIVETVLRRFQFIQSELPGSVSLSDLQNELRFLLPSPETLVSLLMKLCATVEQGALVYVRALTVLRLYMECLPQAMSEVKADFTKLLAWSYLNDAQSQRTALDGVILGEILRLLIVVDSNRLVFLVTSGIGSGAGTTDGKASSKLFQLLRLYVNTRSDAVRLLARSVLHRVFAALNVFGVLNMDVSPSSFPVRGGLVNTSPDEEITVWLEHLLSGGEESVYFVALLLQELFADPFSFVDVLRQRGAGDDEEQAHFSPATIALISAFNQWNSISDRWSKVSTQIEIARNMPAVLAFGSRVLLSLLCRAESPLVFARVIFGSQHLTDTATDPDQRSKKRRRTQSLDLNNKDAYRCLQLFCQRLVSSSNSRSIKTVVLKSGHEASTEQWTTDVTDKNFPSTISATNPVSFVSHLSVIAKDVLARGLSLQYVNQYIEGRPDVDLAQILLMASTTKGRRKEKSVLLPQIVQQLPLHLYAQSVMFLLATCDRDGQDEVIEGKVTIILGELKSSIMTMIIDPADAMIIADKILLSLRLSISISSSSPTVTDSLIDILQRLSVILWTSSLEADKVDFVTTRAQRTARKLTAIIEHAKNSSATIHRKLAAVEVTTQIVRCHGTLPGSCLNLYQRFLSSGAVTVAALAPVFPVVLNLDVLHKLLILGTTLQPGNCCTALVQNILESLAGDLTLPSNASIPAGLSQRLWKTMMHTRPSKLEMSGNSLSFYSTGLHLVTRLGGIPRDMLEASNTIEIWVEIVTQCIAQAQASKLDEIVTLLRRLKIAMRADSSAHSAVTQVLEMVLAKLSNDSSGGISLLLGVAATLPIMRGGSSTIALTAIAEKIAIECVHSILRELKKGSERKAEEALRLSIIRGLMSLSISNPSRLTHAIVAVAGSQRSKAKKVKSGEPLSATQILCILLCVRKLKDIDDVHLLDLVSWLVHSSVQLLKNATQEDASEDVDLTIQGHRYAIEHCVRFIPLETLPSASKAIQTNLKELMLVNVNCEAAYVRFIQVSALLLPLCASSSPLHDAKEHLASVVDSEFFAASLVNTSRNVELLRVVAYLIRLGGGYDRRLFQYLLGAYNMSLSLADRIIRVLLDDFEVNGSVTMSQYGYRFGASFSVPSLTLLDGKARMDLVEDSAWLISGGLEQSRVRATIEHFPLERAIAVGDDRKLVSFAGADGIYGEGGEESDRGDSITDGDSKVLYDPSTLLPMLSHFTASSGIPDMAMVQQGLLGFAIRATSSNADDVRAHAFGILAHVHEYSSGDATDFKPGRQVHLLLDSLRNALETPLEGVSSVITVFMSDTLSILSRPAHSMYPHVNHFLLARPAIDLNDVPMFYSLFNSRSPLTYKQERSWLLHSLRRGVREDADVSLLIRRHVPSILLSFFNSVLADEHTKLLVGSILLSMLQTETGSSYLLCKCGFLEWLCTQFEQCDATTSLALLARLGELVEVSLSADTWSEFDYHQRRSLSSAAVSCFSSLIAAKARCSPWVVDTRFTRFPHVALLILQQAYAACSLSTLGEIADAVESSSVALECMEALISERLLVHPDFHKDRFPSWATLFVRAATILSAVMTHRSAAEPIVASSSASKAASRLSDLDLQLRTDGTAHQLRTLLHEAPTLKRMVLHELRHDVASHALLL